MKEVWKISDTNKQVICDLYKTKCYNVAEIARQLNLPKNGVNYVVKDLKVKMGLKKWQRLGITKKVKEKVKLHAEIRDLYKTKQYTYEELGQKFGLTRERIRQIVSDLRIELGLNKYSLVKKVNRNTEACIKRKALVAEEHAKIREYYLQTKKPISEIAKKFCKSQYYIWAITKDMRLSRKESTKLLHTFIRQLYMTGKYSYKELAIEVGMSVPSMHNICKGIYTARAMKRRKKAVRCIETNEVFDSIKEASKYFNVSNTYLGAHLHNRVLCNGYKIKSIKGYHFEFINK